MSFVVTDGDTLKVMADVSVEVEEEQFSDVFTGQFRALHGRTWYEDEMTRI